jgi:hypothetical protein
MIVVETCPKCGAPLMDSVICTYPPIPRKDCPSCGWFWEGKPERIAYQPFVPENDVAITEVLNGSKTD